MIIKRGFGTCILFFLLLSTNAFSSFELNARVQKAYLQIIRLNFDAGKQLLDQEQRANPENQLPLLYYNYIDYLKAFISEESKDIETFNDNTRKRSKLLRSESSPYYLYVQSELLFQEFMINLKASDYFSAAWKIKKSYDIIGTNSKRFPEFLLNKKITGILNVLIGTVPQDYHWLAEIAGLQGSIEEGTSQLISLLKETDGTSYEVYREEILFYLSNIQLTFSQNPGQLASTAEIIRPYCSGNALMLFSMSNILIKSGRNEEALAYLTDSAVLKDSYPCYILLYKTGLVKLNKLDYTSEKDFQQFILHFHGMNFLRSAYQKLAWIHLLQGDQNKYNEYIRICKTIGINSTDEDIEATEESKSGEMPNLILLRARLLFDGGYYMEAMKEIAGQPIDRFPRLKDQLEVSYRFARILHKLAQTDKAISFFEKTIQNGASSKYYFAANSALMLGMIYEENKDMEKAKSYYLKCLSMRKHGYQNSIDQKAKAGLSRLKMN